MRSDQFLQQHYKLGSDLSLSARHSVLKARFLETSEKRMVHVYPKRLLESDESFIRIISEITSLSRIDHPNGLRLHEFYQDSLNYYIITERALGDCLLDRVVRSGYPTEATIAGYLQQILSLLSHLQSLHIVHRNLKPENLIFSSECSEILKLVSFKASVILHSGERATGRVGHHNYISPEALKGAYDYRSDMWSAGVIMYLLLGGVLPFKATTQEGVLRAVSLGRFALEGPNWELVSGAAKDLIRRILVLEPEGRISLEEALGHPWFTNTSNQLPPKEIAAPYIANLSEFKAKEKCKRCVFRYIGAHYIQEAERSELLTLFKGLDANQNGTLSKQELKDGCFRLFGNRIKNADAEFDRIIAEVDLDRSGEISYNEFAVAVIGKHKVLEKKRLEDVFKSLDINNNGLIDIGELRTMLSRFTVSGDNIQELIKECDTNADGCIDLDEFVKVMRRR